MLSESALFLITVICSVGNDDMVEEVEAHGLAGSLDVHRQAIVLLTGMEAA